MLRTRFFQSTAAASLPFSSAAAVNVAAVRAKSDQLAKKRILVTGANGQIGSELINLLRSSYGHNHVLATDVVEPGVGIERTGPFRLLNALDRTSIEKVVCGENIGTILHLAAIMSVKGEANPHLCMELGFDAVSHMLEVARMHDCMLYVPSSIAAFSPESGKNIASDSVHQDPKTIYGITKVYAEKVGAYYHAKLGVDFRSLRYPGIISAGTQPGGGTTDYSVWMYHYALQKKKYYCPVAADEHLPMMYLPDCMESTVKMLEAPRADLRRSVYNIASMSLCPRAVEESIKKVMPDFEVDYSRIDPTTQAIAASWPDSMNDDAARADIKWQPRYDLDKVTADMLTEIEKTYGKRGKFTLN